MILKIVKFRKIIWIDIGYRNGIFFELRKKKSKRKRKTKTPRKRYRTGTIGSTNFSENKIGSTATKTINQLVILFNPLASVKIFPLADLAADEFVPLLFEEALSFLLILETSIALLGFWNGDVYGN